MKTDKQSKRKLLIRIVISPMCLIFLGACATVHSNPKLDEKIDDADIINRQLNPADRSDELLFILTLSGGGTRAAALAYGVMEALNQVEIPARSSGKATLAEDAANHALLKEVDLISSVSGGSFTSAYYGLYGDRLFEDFRERFLYRNVQASLIWRVLNPINWARLLLTGYNRSNLAADYYDKILFDNATFGDMHSKESPFVMIQATDIIDGYNFTFMPSIFNLICSDLREIPVSFAVTASSSFPGVFSGLSLLNYGGTCGNTTPSWVHEAYAKKDPLDISYQLAKKDLAYRDSEKKKYVHLFDGGVNDNLGLRSPFTTIVQMDLNNEFEAHGLGKTKKVVFIIVNAQITRSADNSILNQLPDTPGTSRTVSAAITTIMNSTNFDTLFIFKEFLLNMKKEDTTTEVYPIHLTFENLDDPEEQHFFLNVSTALSLDDEIVEKLIEVGGRLLYKNEEFQRLVKDLGGTITDRQNMTGKTDSELLELIR